MRFAMAPATRPQLEMREAALNDFFARLVITEQGRFNLSDVAAPAEPAASAAPAAASAPAAAASAASAAAPGGELPIDLSVGGVKLVNGRVDFSDRFIRPNYSADLTELNGRSARSAPARARWPRSSCAAAPPAPRCWTSAAR